MDDRALALKVASEATPESFRDILSTIIVGAWRTANGELVPYALPQEDLQRLRRALSAAMDVIEQTDTVDRPDVLAQRRAAVAAEADVPLQAFLASLHGGQVEGVRHA